MSPSTSGPHCPECGEPIGQTATYCMHCSADLTDDREAADIDGDGTWDQTETPSTASQESNASYIGASSGGRDAAYGQNTSDTLGGSSGGEETDQLLDPDGIVDNSLTVIVGILGGIIVGVVESIVLTITTTSVVGVLLGIITGVGVTAYLVRQRTVQGAIAKAGYGVAIAIVSLSAIAFSPALSTEGGSGSRIVLFFVFIIFATIPAVVAAGIGWIASRYVPETERRNEE